MTTVGYGDITAITINEKIFAMFSMIIACGVFAYTVGSIGSLVSKQNAMENAYREQVVAVNRYMRKKELPYDLQFRVRRYLEYVWENKKRNNLDEKQILKLLSEPLRDEIYAHIHGIVIKLCAIFTNYESHFIAQVTRALEGETYAPGDTVIEEGEMSSKMYFIQNGKIDIFHHSTKSTFKELGPNEYFGEIAFFTERPRCASAKCLDFVDLLSLSRTIMNELLEKFPEAKEKTAQLTKKCEEGDYSELLVKCYICKDLGHFAIKCKKILLNLDHDDTKKKWLDMRTKPAVKNIKSSENPEPKFKRNVRKRMNLPVESKNVIGIPRDSTLLFANDSTIYPKIKNYVHKYGIEEKVDQTQNSLNRPVTRARPKYTFICNSEGTDEDEDHDSDSDSQDDEYPIDEPKFNNKGFEDSSAIESPSELEYIDNKFSSEKNADEKNLTINDSNRHDLSDDFESKDLEALKSKDDPMVIDVSSIVEPLQSMSSNVTLMLPPRNF